ncbi:MAG TPA: hypothetical protein VJ717_04090 [Gemmatimonadaceae bacterium]|nr:hypothetical protein [Gemmatimonadaceae bacterium]
MRRIALLAISLLGATSLTACSTPTGPASTDADKAALAKAALEAASQTLPLGRIALN